MVTTEQIDKCIEVAKRYGARRLVLFGSAVNDPEHAHDIDIICDGIAGWEFFGMVSEMNDAAKTPVDVIPYESGNGFVDLAVKRGRSIYERI